jgi:hypothetical protein
VLVFRCEDTECGYERDADSLDRGGLLALVTDEDECPDCGGPMELAEVDLAEELDQFAAALAEADATFAMIIERQPGLREQIELAQVRMQLRVARSLQLRMKGFFTA